MKKILSLVLSNAMVCAICVCGSLTAFAASPIEAVNGTDSANVKGTYVAGSATSTVYSVDIAWGSMEFTYTDASEGTWNPLTQEYTDATAAGWSCETDANKITVTNRSNAAIDADLSYANATGYNLTAQFTNSESAVITSLSLPTAEAYGTTSAGSRTDTAYMNFTAGALTSGTAAKTTLGTITVTISDAE